MCIRDSVSDKNTNEKKFLVPCCIRLKERLVSNTQTWHVHASIGKTKKANLQYAF